MRNLAICGAGVAAREVTNPSLTGIRIEGVAVSAALVDTPDVSFDPADPDNARRVLVRVRAFSCNYRDKNLILKMAARGPADSFYVVGSEFAGEVVAIGEGVARFRPGDRVIADGSYPPSEPGVPVGLPTNNGSRELLVVHEAKLIAIPDAMPYDVAAAFQIGAQTTYSMLRKLRLTGGENVLVTAAKSNTSLFAINALQRCNVNVFATTTSARFRDELIARGVKDVIVGGNGSVSAVAHDLGGFDAVVDPFFDLHVAKATSVMAYGGRYVTCGVYDQFSQLAGTPASAPLDGGALLLSAMLRNLQLIGNCLGSTADLQAALDDYAAGRLDVVIDSVHTSHRVGDFLSRTYNAPDRFGKVVFQYE